MLDGNAKYSVLEVPCLIAKIMMGDICMIWNFRSGVLFIYLLFFLICLQVFCLVLNFY